MAPRVNLQALFLSGVTGMTLAGVSLLAYLRFEHPQQFAETSIKMSRPELGDDLTRKWGLYGSGMWDAVPQRVKDWFVIPDLAERFEKQKQSRATQIRGTIEDMRPENLQRSQAAQLRDRIDELRREGK